MPKDTVLNIGNGITATVHEDGDVSVRFKASDKALFKPSASGKRDIMTVSSVLPNGMTIGGNLMAFAGYAKS